ncbi:MAG: hypothetical protein ACFCU3_05410 [Verrucomicrobiales bacterium]
MIANAQNKCGVPGICTLSGQGILRTFRATGDVRLLDLLRDIAHALPQFVSRPDHRIPTLITWAHPHAELPVGWMCERVNVTPSWAEPLGEQAAYSCWCEVAMILTWCDLPGVYAQPDTGLIRCLDHVRASWTNASRTALRLENPTAFPARVRIQVETSVDACAQILPVNFAATLPQVTIPPVAVLFLNVRRRINNFMNPKPNILFIMTDQLRLDCVGFGPEGKCDTPNINRIAEGSIFTACQTPNPLCQPARAAGLHNRHNTSGPAGVNHGCRHGSLYDMAGW